MIDLVVAELDTDIARQKKITVCSSRVRERA